MNTDTQEVNAAFNRLSKAALCQQDKEKQCTVECNDLSTILLAYRLEQGNNGREFGVIAGKYEDGWENNENIKYADDGLTIDEAIAKAKDMESYPFCYITYKNARLNVSYS